MRIEFPEYNDGVRHWNKECHIREVDEEDYCKTVADVDKMITNMVKEKNFKSSIDLINYIDGLKQDLVTAIETQKTPTFVGQLYKDWKHINNYSFILNDIPLHLRGYWEDQAKELTAIGLQNWKNTSKFITSNKDDVFQILEQQKEYLLVKRKEKKRTYNETYMNKLKQAGIVKDKVILTTDERKEHRREANKKYYLKKKAMEECEKIT
jgi:hypothetical protein